jgi:hypothetical protein
MSAHVAASKPRPVRSPAVADFMYGGTSLLGKLLTVSPLKLFVLLFLAAILLLVLPSLAIGVASIPLTDGSNVGILHKKNWSLVYPLLFPAIFATASWLAPFMRDRLADLVRPDFKVIQTEDGGTAVNYLDQFALALRRSASWLFWSCVGIALVVLIADTQPIVHGMFLLARNQQPSFGIWDWSVAYGLGSAMSQSQPIPGWSPPHPVVNWLFDALAYGFEGFYVFLGFFWVGKYWLYLKTFADLMIPAGTPYKFVPKVANPSLNLGLKPIGTLYNGFLVVTLLFYAYVVYHRFQDIPIFCHSDFKSVSDYLAVLFKVYKNPGSLLDGKIYALGCLDLGLWILLAGVLIPLFVIVYFPLLRLRRYIEERRYAEVFTIENDLNSALEQGDEERAKRLRRQKKQLEKAAIWPNGNVAGWTFLTLTTVCVFVAWVPPIGAYVIVAGGVFFIAKVLPDIVKSWFKSASSD